MLTKEEAIRIARRYWKAKRPSESAGIRHWEISTSKGSTNHMPDNDFEIPPQKKFFENCWIIELFNIDVKDYSPAYIVWIETKTKKVVRSGIYEVHCLYDFSRWFIETTNKREKDYKLDSAVEIPEHLASLRKNSVTPDEEATIPLIETRRHPQRKIKRAG